MPGPPTWEEARLHVTEELDRYDEWLRNLERRTQHLEASKAVTDLRFALVAALASSALTGAVAILVYFVTRGG